MNGGKHAGTVLEDIRVPVKIRIALLWAAVTLCYIYGDYFELYVPGKLQQMLAGRMGPLGAVTQNVLLGTSILLAVPSVMVFASLVLKPRFNRVLNIALGTAYTAIMLLAVQGAWHFYVLMGVVEMGLTASIVWHAWRWPRHAAIPAS